DTAIGERLRRVRRFLDDDEVFLANYGDVLTDAPMDRIVDDFLATDAVGSLMAVAPQDSFHVVRYDPDGTMRDLEPVADMSMCINGGYFVLRQGIFDYLGEGEDLVMDACVRAARAGRFRVHPHTGFWAPMDTLKERSALEEMNRVGDRPWAVWDRGARPAPRRVPEVEVGEVVGPARAGA
ncbi:glucose-1-phosphate cytidylyltransferase, partial [Isoptericola sp. NPDC060257]